MDFKNPLKGIFNKSKEPNQKEVDEAVTQMVNVIKNQRTFYKREIRDWKLARQRALGSIRPRRDLLINLYEDILGDAFIFGRTETRKLRISNKGYVIKSKGEINLDLTELLERQWFNQLLKYATETSYFGYSLMYPKELDENGYIKEISMVYRDHIIPQEKELLVDINDNKGIKFHEGVYKKWMLWINYEDTIGLLDKAAPLYIFKKHSWQNWDEFEEMFGIPLRIAKVASSDKRVQAEVDKWLRDLGSAAYARFPEGVEIDIKESTYRDSFNVFNEKRKACNEELATLIDGNFETAKDTGNLSKAEAIIASTQSLIELDDEIRVQFFINDRVLPWLREMGYPFDEEDKFDWNHNQQSTPKERLDIFKGVKELGYKIKREQIESELNVEIEGEYTETPSTPNVLPKDKINARVGFNQPHAHHVGCGCGACDLTYRKIDFTVLNALSKDEEEFLKKYWENPDSITWNYKDFKASHQPLIDSLQQGFGVIDFDFESSDHLTMELFKANIHRFGVDKTVKEIMDLNHILKTSEDFSEYRERVKKLFPNYKEKWLTSERNQAYAVSQMGAKYIQMMQDIDVAPYWRLVAVIDDGTTFICRSLHDMVFRKDDIKAWQFLPPNHWGCRSDAEDVLSSYNGVISTFDDAVSADPDGYERMSKSGFNINWGEAREVFSATQNYLYSTGVESPDVLDFDFTAFGLSPFFELKSNRTISSGLFNFSKYRDRSGLAKIEDVQGMPSWLNHETFTALDKQTQRALTEIMKTPDEIYWYQIGDIHYKRFLKYYKEGTYQVIVSFNQDTRAVIQSVSKLSDVDNHRRGLLIYTPVEHIAYRKNKYDSYGTEYTKLGFDKANGGYLVAHQKHDYQELKNNIVTGELLKKLGKNVELLPVGIYKANDALLNGTDWEFKLLTHYSNLFNRIKEEVKRASKQSGNVLLHINGKHTNSDVIRGLYAAVKNDDKRRIRFISLLFNDQRMYVFSRRQIESKEFEMLLKK